MLRNAHAEVTVFQKAMALGAKPVALGIKGYKGVRSGEKVICQECTTFLDAKDALKLDDFTAIWPWNL